MIFGRGSFLSTACRPYGFTKAKYKAWKDGENIAYEMTTTSPTDGTMDWKGKVAGDKIEGSVKWTDRDGKSDILTYTGDLLP